MRASAGPSPVRSTFLSVVPTGRNSSNTASCLRRRGAHPGIGHGNFGNTVLQPGGDVDLGLPPG